MPRAYAPTAKHFDAITAMRLKGATWKQIARELSLGDVDNLQGAYNALRCKQGLPDPGAQFRATRKRLVASLHANGLSFAAIARRLGYSTQTVSRITTPEPHMTPEERVQFVAIVSAKRAEGMSFTDIGEHLGLSFRQVQQRWRRIAIPDPGHAFRKARNAEMLALRKQGKSNVEICRLTGISQQYVSKLLRDIDGPAPRGKAL
jgi:DNA-binding CsgD family transcriptional regulator